MNKFFKKGWRGKGGGGGGAADDEEDGEMVDFDSSEMTFNDLQHIRDRGRYGMNASSTNDSSTYIPTLITRPSGAESGKLSNTEYRKQLTAAKKLLYTQAANANGSRALTMQGDPRLQAYGGMMPTDPRSMSLNTSAMATGQQFQIPLAQNGIHPNDPRSMSLNTAAMAAGQQFQVLPPQNGPRAMSLTNSARNNMQLAPMQYPPHQQMRPIPNVQQQQQQQPPYYNNNAQQLRPTTLLQQNNYSDPRLNSLSQMSRPSTNDSPSGSSDTVRNLPSGYLNSSNTSQMSFQDDKVTPTRPNFGETENSTGQQKEAKRVLKKINFNSTPTKEEPKVEDESPLKSLISGVSLVSEDFNNQRLNTNLKIYSLSQNDTAQNDVFITASQFSLQDIEEENSLKRDTTLNSDRTLETVDQRSDISKTNSSTKSKKRRSFMKRLSFGKLKPSQLKPDVQLIKEEEQFQYTQPTMGRKNRDFSFESEKEVFRTAPLKEAGQDDAASSMASLGNLSGVISVSTRDNVQKLNFTIEQLGVMQSNTRLLKELEMVSNELAASIAREVELDAKFSRNSPTDHSSSRDDAKQLREQARQISDLVTQLGEERRKRYIAEEHVLRWESGEKPSILDLNYQNSEMVQRLTKQDNLIKEYESKFQISSDENRELLSKVELLQKDNDSLKWEVVPNLENQITILEHSNQLENLEQELQSLKIQNEELRFQSSQIKSIEDQKLALREALKNMKENYDHELRIANDKIRSLQQNNRSSFTFETSVDQSPLHTPTRVRRVLPFDE